MGRQADTARPRVNYRGEVRSFDAGFEPRRDTIRLSPDVASAFRAGGTGWQTRMDTALREWLKGRSVA